MPRLLPLPKKLAEALAPQLWLGGSKDSAGCPHPEEAVHACVLFEKRPVEPTGFVVLTVGVVIAALGAPHFIAHDEHRHTEREHCRDKEVLHLPVSEVLDSRIIGRALDAAIPAS